MLVAVKPYVRSGKYWGDEETHPFLSMPRLGFAQPIKRCCKQTLPHVLDFLVLKFVSGGLRPALTSPSSEPFARPWGELLPLRSTPMVAGMLTRPPPFSVESSHASLRGRNSQPRSVMMRLCAACGVQPPSQ